MVKVSFSHYNFQPLGSSLICEQVNTNAIYIKKKSGREDIQNSLCLHSLLLPGALLFFSVTRKYESVLSSKVINYHVLYGHTYSKGKDQPSKVPNPAHGQSAHSPYSGSIWCFLTGLLPSSAMASICLFKTAIRHRVSPEFVGSRNCVPMAFTAESPPAQGK